MLDWLNEVGIVEELEGRGIPPCADALHGTVALFMRCLRMTMGVDRPGLIKLSSSASRRVSEEDLLDLVH